MFAVCALKFPLAGTSAAVREVPEVFQQGKLYKENRALQDRVKALENKILRLQEASHENQRLRGLLNFKAHSKYICVPAQIVARDLTNFSDTAIIDKGRNSSVKVDMAVVSSHGLVGRVIEVGPNASKVLLLSDMNFRCAALVQRSREQGVIEGTSLGNCRLKFLTLNADVKPGDAVITAGLGSLIPKGILVGEVSAIREEKPYLTKSAYIKPAANISKLEEVLCVE